jgi:hypothetical protein
MSTKASLCYGPKHHLYQEALDCDAVFLEIAGCDFQASCLDAAAGEVTVRIPLAIWEHIRGFTIASFDLADLTDPDLQLHVHAKCEKRQQDIAKSRNEGLAKFTGCLVWAGNTPEEELMNGMKWFEGERARQRALRSAIAELRGVSVP